MADSEQSHEHADEEKTAGRAPLITRVTNWVVDFIVTTPIFIVLWVMIDAFANKEDKERLEYASSVVQGVVDNFDPWHLITYYREALGWLAGITLAFFNFIMALVHIPSDFIAAIDGILYVFVVLVLLGPTLLAVPFVILFDMFTQGRIIEGLLTIPIYLICLMLVGGADRDVRGRRVDGSSGFLFFAFVFGIAIFIMWTIKLFMVIVSELLFGYTQLAGLATGCGICAASYGWFAFRRAEHSITDRVIHWARRWIGRGVEAATKRIVD